MIALALAAILGLEQRDLLDRGVDALRRARIERYHLGVGDMRRLIDPALAWSSRSLAPFTPVIRREYQTGLSPQ